MAKILGVGKFQKNKTALKQAVRELTGLKDPNEFALKLVELLDERQKFKYSDVKTKVMHSQQFGCIYREGLDEEGIWKEALEKENVGWFFVMPVHQSFEIIVFSDDVWKKKKLKLRFIKALLETKNPHNGVNLKPLVTAGPTPYQKARAEVEKSVEKAKGAKKKKRKKVKK